MPSAKTRFPNALTARLIQALPQDRVDAFIGGTHTADLRDNVVPTISDEQLAILRAQLEAGDGGELTPTKSGKSTGHAPYSSAALALNAFGGFVGHESDLTIHGIGGWTSLEIEAKLQIAHRGGRANLDALLRAPGRVLGVESKLTEYASSHLPRNLKPVYGTDEMRAMLSGGWRHALDALLSGEFACNYLDPEQLVKHALSLHSQFPDDARALTYVFLEPANVSEVPELGGHADELQQLLELLGDDADPAFEVITYDDLFREWSEIASPAISQHVAALAARYGNLEI